MSKVLGSFIGKQSESYTSTCIAKERSVEAGGIEKTSIESSGPPSLFTTSVRGVASKGVFRIECLWVFTPRERSS